MSEENITVCDNCNKPTSEGHEDWCGDSSEDDYLRSSMIFTPKNEEISNIKQTSNQITEKEGTNDVKLDNNQNKELEENEKIHQERMDEEEKLREEEELKNTPFAKIIESGSNILGGERAFKDMLGDVVDLSKETLNTPGGTMQDKLNNFFGKNLLDKLGFNDLLKKETTRNNIQKFIQERIGKDKLDEYFREASNLFNLEPNYIAEFKYTYIVPNENENNNNEEEVTNND